MLVTIVAVSLFAWAVVLRTWFHLRAQQPWQVRQVPTPHDGRPCFELVVPRDRKGGAEAPLSLRMRQGSMERSAFELRIVPLVRQRLVVLETPLPLIAVLATAMPLLGLLGTVVGMMQTFGELTAQGVDRSEAFASGISRAMVTTQAGLVVAVPVLLVHRLLGARIRRHGEAALLTIRRLEAAVCRD